MIKFAHVFIFTLVLTLSASVQAQTTRVEHSYSQILSSDDFNAFQNKVSLETLNSASINHVSHNANDPKILTLSFQGRQDSYSDSVVQPQVSIYFPALDDALRAKYYLEYTDQSFLLISNLAKSDYCVKGPLIAIRAEDIYVKNLTTQKIIVLQNLAKKSEVLFETSQRFKSNKAALLQVFKKMKKAFMGLRPSFKLETNKDAAPLPGTEISQACNHEILPSEIQDHLDGTDSVLHLTTGSYPSLGSDESLEPLFEPFFGPLEEPLLSVGFNDCFRQSPDYSSFCKVSSLYTDISEASVDDDLSILFDFYTQDEGNTKGECVSEQELNDFLDYYDFAD